MPMTNEEVKRIFTFSKIISLSISSSERIFYHAVANTDFQVDHLLQVVGPPGPSTQVQWEHVFFLYDWKKW